MKKLFRSGDNMYENKHINV